ncbi:hypothetical protein M3Y97_00268000 [Aphelenchoides bicaudatus]|nr:hypothetical protein M3Y97_00268000 [Aphelenchoides bicaudatus]
MTIKFALLLLHGLSKRRRPASRKAQLVRNPIFAEDEDYTLSEYEDHLSIGNKPKTLMQKLSNWIGGLGNRNKRGRRSDSETRPQIVGPFTDRKVPQMFGNSTIDHYNNNHMNSSVISQQPYELKRPGVCTNPWFLPPETSRSMLGTSLSRTKDLLDASYSSSLSHLSRDEALRINTLGGSACSSGYGSNDNSPECSVHQPSWQPSAQIENRGDLVDKAVECHSLDLDDVIDDENYNHIYYELEPTLSQLKERAAYTDDSCYSGSVELNTHTSALSSRADSPVYAVPFSSAGESSCGSIEYVDDSDGYAELAKRCQPELPTERPPAIEHNNNGYARLQRSVERPSAFTRCVPRLNSPTFFPPPPPVNEFPRTCLDLLDEQIAELKMKTKVVSKLVETAKERQELRDFAKNLCLEHIKDLRNLRLYVERGFELHI